MEILAQFIVTFLQNTLGRLVFFKVCRKGNAIIRTFLGKPIKWSNEPSLYFNIPFLQELILVDMRRRFDTTYAHSFHYKNMEKSLVPFNIIIDMQIEYQVIHPYVIFDIEEINNKSITEEVKFEQNKIKDYIENRIHCELGIYISSYKEDITYRNIINFLTSIVEKYKAVDSISENSIYDITSAVSINNIVLTSFDKNISLRTTV